MEKVGIDMSQNSEPKFKKGKGDWRLEFKECDWGFSGGWHKEQLSSEYPTEQTTNGWQTIANKITLLAAVGFIDFCDSIDGRKTVKQVQELFVLFCKAHEIDPNQFQ
jgi:hypothetical protein